LKAARAALEDSDAILAEASKLVEAAKGKKKDKKEDKDEEKEDKKDKKKKDKKEDKEKDEKEDEESDEDKKKAKALLDQALKVRKQNRLDLIARAYADSTSEDPRAMRPEAYVDSDED